MKNQRLLNHLKRVGALSNKMRVISRKISNGIEKFDELLFQATLHVASPMLFSGVMLVGFSVVTEGTPAHTAWIEVTAAWIVATSIAISLCAMAFINLRVGKAFKSRHKRKNIGLFDTTAQTTVTPLDKAFTAGFNSAMLGELPMDDEPLVEVIERLGDQMPLRGKSSN